MTTDTKPTTRLLCHSCGKPVSTPVPADMVVRAYLECPECLENARGGEPVTIEWLSGLSRDGGDMGFMKVRLIGDAFHLVMGEGEAEVVAKRPATKDDVRGICRMLGLTLTDAVQ